MPGHFGENDETTGVFGNSKSSAEFGVYGSNEATDPPPKDSPGGAGVFGLTVSPGASGVFGANNSDKGRGVQGNGPEVGVGGFSEQGVGVAGWSNSNDAVQGFAKSSAHAAIFGSNAATDAPPDDSPGGAGVFGLTVVPGGAGVFGANNSDKGRGVQGNGPEFGVGGYSKAGVGVGAWSDTGDGLNAFTSAGAKNGILGRNSSTDRTPDGGAPAGNGVFGYTDVPNASGVCGAVSVTNTDGAGVTGIGKVAGRFFGDLVVTGNVLVGGDVQLTGADFAEEFDVESHLEVHPGMVMVLDDIGGVRPCDSAYDTRVAGVVAGAGAHRPGVVMDRRGGDGRREPLALVGKAYCLVDATTSPVEIGDLLTTSATPGHAAKVTDRREAVGAVVGKALAPLRSHRGLIPVLIALG